MGDCASFDTWCKQQPPSTLCQFNNVCNICNNRVQPICDTAQTLCSLGKQQASSTSAGGAGAPTFERDQIIIKVFPQSTLNDLIDYVKDAASKGKDKNSPVPNIQPEDREFIYADKIKELIEALTQVDPSNTSVTPPERDDIITADMMNQIMNALNNMKLSPSACDMCDSSCNSCNTCQGCVTNCYYCYTCQDACQYNCQYCNACEWCNFCEGYYYY